MNQKLIEKLQKGIEQLNAAVLERSDEINGLVIGLLCGVNVLLLGAPGTGKSYLVNMFTKMFSQGNQFSWLMSKTSTPEELFGPISMKGLKNDRYEHNIEGKLPACKVAFLDEIWKSNSAVLNTLLTLANERIFYNGTQAYKTPLELIVGVSNEYPKDSSLDALYDRFRLRFWVEPIKQEKNIIKLISQKRNRTLPVPDITFSEKEVKELREMMLSFPWNGKESKILANIKKALEQKEFSISDRTIGQFAPDLVCAQSLLNGHTKIQGSDWQILGDSFWDRHTDRDVISEYIAEVSDPVGSKLQAIKDQVLDLAQQLPGLDLIKSGQMRSSEYMSQYISPLDQTAKKAKLTLEDMINNGEIEKDGSVFAEMNTLLTAIETQCSEVALKALRAESQR